MIAQRHALRQGAHQRWSRLVLSLLASFALVTGFVAQTPTPTQALSAQDFKPGNIISDSLFYDGNAMSAAQVQSFLDLRVPRCTIGDAGRTAGMAWGNTQIASKCMKNYTQTTSSKPADAYCGSYVGAPNESAAQIIAKVGKACGISQRVLLVMLEKEQSLVTDSWPTVRQLDVAMGANCPDSGPNWSANCDPRYYGFQNQVYRSAWLLKYYLQNPTQYQYRAGQWSTIQYHPNPACGTSQVYIENWATAALYIYTPYRPNQASLNAGWGTGDSCSTYGNRNFFLLYSSWFGSTQTVSHANLDSVTGEYNGIRVTGWARKLSDVSTAYVWVNVYDTAGALVTNKLIAANQPLNWFDSLFPGYGNNHGFNDLVQVSPGSYRVEVFNTSVNSEFISAQTVSVPIAAGGIDSISQSAGSIRVQGWSVDFRTGGAADTIKIVLDGRNPPLSFLTDLPSPSIDARFPGMGNNHAFDAIVPASLGTHTICVYGAVGLLQPCSSFTVSQVEQGSLDTVDRAEGGIRVTGWAINLATEASSEIKVTVNGTSSTVLASAPLTWFDGLYPGAGSNHGFDAIVPLTVSKSGNYEVCIFGAATNRNLGCKSVQLLGGEGTSFDSVTAVNGQIRITGWSAVFGRPDPSYIWVNVNGTGQMYAANNELTWFNNYSPGAGNNHGFDVSIPAAPGRHEVCVYTARTGASAGCRTIDVPAPTEQGHLDGVAFDPASNSLRVWGWSHIAGQPAPSYIWIDVNGTGQPYRADAALSWFDGFAPGQGNAHGFDVRIPAAPGANHVCVSGMGGPTAYGCQTISVP